MGACASKFTEGRKAADAPAPALNEEISLKEVNLVEEVVVKKDDEAKHQSLGHLFKEIEGEKISAESNGKALEGVNQDNGNMKSCEPVADTPVTEETEKAAEIDGVKSKSLEEEKAVDAKPACEDAEMETAKIEEMLVETVKLETADEIPEGNKLIEISGTDKKPETPETEKNEEQKPVLDAEKKKEDEKPAETIKPEILEEKPKTPEMKKTEEPKPDSDVAKNKEEEKLVETIKIGTLQEKPETLVTEKTEEQKPASNAEETKTEEKLTENIKIETPDNLEDKHVLEPPSEEEPSDEKCNEKTVKKPETPNMISVQEEAAPDAEKPKVEEENTKE